MTRLWRNRLALSQKDVPWLSGQDAERCGAPSFSLEQMLQLFAIACEAEKYGRPISHWTPRELADEVKQGIVNTISSTCGGSWKKPI